MIVGLMMHDYTCEKREEKLTQESSLNHSTFPLPFSAFFFFLFVKEKSMSQLRDYIYITSHIFS